jgi:hypothetical protein
MSYRVLEDPEKIREYVNGEVREEWKNDIRNADKDTNTSNWLGTLSSELATRNLLFEGRQ